MADRSIYEIAAATLAHNADKVAEMPWFRTVVDAVVREALAEVARQLAEESELHPSTEAALTEARTALIGGKG